MTPIEALLGAFQVHLVLVVALLDGLAATEDPGSELKAITGRVVDETFDKLRILGDILKQSTKILPEEHAYIIEGLTALKKNPKVTENRLIKLCDQIIKIHSKIGA